MVHKFETPSYLKPVSPLATGVRVTRPPNEPETYEFRKSLTDLFVNGNVHVKPKKNYY